EDRVCPENGKGSKIGLPSSCWGGACSATPQDPYRLRPIRRGMKAARLFSYDKPLKLVDVETPRLKNPADVIVRVTGAGVCHTDLHIVEGVWRMRGAPRSGRSRRRRVGRPLEVTSLCSASADLATSPSSCSGA